MDVRLCMGGDITIFLEEFPLVCTAGSVFSNNMTVCKTLFQIIATDNTLCVVSVVQACDEGFGGGDVGDGTGRVRI